MTTEEDIYVFPISASSPEKLQIVNNCRQRSFEYYNANYKYERPTDHHDHVAKIIKSESNGIFSFI